VAPRVHLVVAGKHVHIQLLVFVLVERHFLRRHAVKRIDVDKLETRAELLPMSVPGLVDEELPALLQSRRSELSELRQIRDWLPRGSALRLSNDVQQTPNELGSVAKPRRCADVLRTRVLPPEESSCEIVLPPRILHGSHRRLKLSTSRSIMP
jgi:hypothetical protein